MAPSQLSKPIFSTKSTSQTPLSAADQISPLLRSQLRRRRRAISCRRRQGLQQDQARQIVDSRGNPTVEVDLITEEDSLYSSAIPSAASTEIYEALELRDDDNTVLYVSTGLPQAKVNSAASMM